MKIDGLTLLEGSQIINPVVARGTSFPTGPASPPDIGEIFYLTSGNIGLHYCSATDGTNGTWIKIASSEMDPDLVAIAELTGTSGLLKKTAANTWTLDTTAYATQSGLNAVAGAPGKLMVGDSWPLTPEPLQMFYATAAIGAAPIGFYYWDDVGASWVAVQPAQASWDVIEGTPTTISGYGITDAYTKTETYTQAEVNSAISAATPTFASLTGKPTTLSGYGITDGQPLDGDLTSIAGLSGTSGILTKTAADTWSLDTNTYLTAHPSVSGATSANNSGLTYVQDLTFDANGHVTGIQSAAIQSASTTQSGVVQLSDSTSTTNSAIGATSTAVKSAYDVASAALPLVGGSMSGSIVIPTSHHISITDAPVNGTDAVNKNYVDGNLAGLTWKNSVKAATNGNITLSGAQTVDGVALVAGNRVLVKDQTTTTQNGIYIVAAGAWTRALDMDATTPINEVNSAAVFVEGGTVYADTGWTQVNNVSTLGTDPIAFTQFNGASGITAGVGLVKTGNTLDVNLGAGIAQLPTDEVGVDVYATGGLMTTVDGTTSSTLTNAQLSLTKVGTAGTYKSVTTDDFGRVTAGSNPTTLAGYGITDAQALDADLTAIAALAGTSGFLTKTAANTWALDTTTYATNSLAMHLAGAETATGLKTFNAGIKLPDDSHFYLGTTNTLDLYVGGGTSTVRALTGTLTLTTAATGESLWLTCANNAGASIEVAYNNVRIESNSGTFIRNAAGTDIAQFVTGAMTFTGSVTITQDISTAGSTAYFNAGSMSTQAPAIAVGGITSPHASQYTKDKGVRFYYNNGANKFGFFGFKNSTGKFTFIPDATYSADVFSGTKGTIDAFLAWSDVTGKPTTLSGYGITDSLQPLDADLTAIAALAGTSGFLKKTAADTWTLDTNTYLTSETDTLASVTARGATTTTVVSLNSGAIIQAAGTSAALRITQTGTGNALVIEDSANPDSTPFVIDQTGTTIIGHTSLLTLGGYTPLLQTHRIGTVGLTASKWINDQSGPVINLFKSRGSNIETQGSVVLNDELGRISFAGDDGTSFNSIGAAIYARVDGTVSAGVFPSRLVFGTANSSTSVPIERFTISSTGLATFNNDVTITGNLTINGTTTTVNSTTVSIDDPVFTLGGTSINLTDDNKDRGIEFRYHNGITAKTGFFGFDDSTGKFTFIPDATNTSEVFSGTKGTIDANIDWADILNKPSSGAGAGTVTSVGGTGTVSGLTLTGTVTSSGSLTLGGTLALVNADIPATLTGKTINGTTIPTSKTLVVTTDIGTSVQAYDADLSAIAALAGTSGILTKTAANTWSLDTTAYATDSLVMHLAGNETVTGAKTFTANPYISNATPAIYLIETDAGVDLGRWISYVNGGVYRLQTRTDADAAIINALSIDRSGNTTIAGTVTADSFNSITGLSSTTPSALGTAAVGTGVTVARADHVHAMPNLDGLSDVTITTNSAGEILKWNGTAWINNTLAEAGIQAAGSYQPLDADLTSWASVTRAAGIDTFVTTPSSANLKAAVTDETGSGALVFATSPTLVTPVLGAASCTSLDTNHGRTTSGTLATAAVTQAEVPLSLSATTYRTVEYLVQATSGTTYHTSKVHVIHDGTNTWVDEYSTMFTSASLYTVTADISGGNIRLLVTPASATATTFKVVANAIDV